MRVLLADDDPEVRSVLTELLTGRGAQVVEANDGMQAFGVITRSVLHGEPLDAIVLDAGIPRLGGTDAVSRMLRLKPTLAIIVLTRAIEPALHRQARASGARAVFVKPVHLPSLWAVIGGALPSTAVSDPPRRAPNATLPTPWSRRETHVLVIDDDHALATVVVEFLQSRGYIAVAANDAPTALRVLLQWAPDIILLDIHMPGLTGVDALPTFRAVAPRTTVIMVSANADVDLAKRALTHGAFDYLVKPVNFVHLAESLEMAVQRQALDIPLDIPKPPSARGADEAAKI